MRNNFKNIVICIIINLVLPGVVIALPDFPAPPDANVEWVSRNMEVNGIRSDIRSFNTLKSLNNVINFYSKEWDDPVEKGMPGYLIEAHAMSPWTVISRIEDGYLMTVQTMESDRGGAWGYLAMSPLPGKGTVPI